MEQFFELRRALAGPSRTVGSALPSYSNLLSLSIEHSGLRDRSRQVEIRPRTSNPNSGGSVDPL